MATANRFAALASVAAEEEAVPAASVAAGQGTAAGGVTAAA